MTTTQDLTDRLKNLVQVPALCLLMIVISACSSEANNNIDSNQGAKIAIIGAGDFVPDRTGAKKAGLPDALVARINERLSNSKRFVVLERSALRRVILEGRFGQERPESDTDRLLEKAVSSLEDIDAVTLATAGKLSQDNDVLRDFQDLGNTAGADYLVYAKLEKLQRTHTDTAVPYSQQNKIQHENKADARLYLRVIEVKSGRIVGAASLRSQQSETVSKGITATQDNYSIYDQIGQQAASKIIDMVFPAKIVGSEPWVINRGTNDGVKVGDIYTVHREGKAIKDSKGITLGRVKTQVGKIKLEQVQNTLTVVALLEGNIANNDLLEVVSGDKQNPSVASAASVGLKRPGATNGQLPRIAVGLVKTGSTARTGNSAAQHMPLFTDTLLSRLTQTKRFQLIDRQEVDQLLNEQIAQAMTDNRPMPSAMGTLQGADYLVYGSVASISVEEKTTRLPGSSKTFTSNIGRVEGNMRIVDARSGDILESRKISVKQKLDPSATKKRQSALLADAYAEQVVLKLMSAIYPIKVAAVTPDGTVYINRGNDGGLTVGETLQAYRPGQAIIDPDTGVQLGVSETALGSVIISEVEDARAKGRASTQLHIGDLLKRSAHNKHQRASVANSTQPPARSGADLSGAKPKGKATLVIGKIVLNRRGKNALLNSNSISRVTEDLIVKLSQTQRFDIMERQQLDQLLDEKIFTAITQEADLAASLQQLQGADYLIYGTVDDFYINTEQRHVATLNTTQKNNTGVVEASLRIVDVHSGKVIAADKIRINQKLKRNDDRRQIVNALIDDTTSIMVSKIVARLYPIKVLGLAGDGIVFVNSGQSSGLKAGDQYMVMRAGEALLDPDTGVSFGTAEMQIAKVELTAIETGRSRAKVMSGGDVQKGDILRKVSSATARMEKDKIKKINNPSF